MKRINYYLLLLATMLCVSSLNAQKEYSIDCVTIITIVETIFEPGKNVSRMITVNDTMFAIERFIARYISVKNTPVSQIDFYNFHKNLNYTSIYFVDSNILKIDILKINRFYNLSIL
jgi:hypothetical protein